MLCTSCGVLVGVNDDTCYNCGRRESQPLGLRSRASRAGDRPRLRAVRHRHLRRALCADAGRFSAGSIGMSGLFSLLSPSSRALFLFGASGPVPVFAGRTLVDDPERRLAARRTPAHLHQHDGAASARAGRRGSCTVLAAWSSSTPSAASAGFALSSFAGAYIPPLPCSGGGQFTVGASASIAGLIGAVLAYGQRSGSTHGPQLRDAIRSSVLVIIGFFVAGHRQLRAHAAASPAATSQPDCSTP